MSPVLLIFSLLTQNVSFANANQNELTLFERLAAIRGIAFMKSGSLRVEIELLCDKDQYDGLTRAFEMEFGGRIVNHRFVQTTDSALPVFTVDYESISTRPAPHMLAASHAGEFATTSLVSRAFRSEVSHQGVKPGERLISCSYSLHPWITKSLQLTETIEGTFSVEMNGKTRLVPFLFDPE